MLVCEYASMRVCKYASMQVCKYASMRVCEYASMFNLASMCGSKGLMSTLTPTDRPVQILISEDQNGHHCNAIIWGSHCNYLGLQYKYVKSQLRSEVPPVSVQILWSSSDVVGFFFFIVIWRVGYCIAPPGANPSICVRHSQLTGRPGRQFAKAKITNEPKSLLKYIFQWNFCLAPNLQKKIWNPVHT